MRPALPARILQPGGLGLLSPRTAQRLERVVAAFRQFDSMEILEVSKSASGRNLLLGKSDVSERQKEQLAWMAEIRALLTEARSLLEPGESWSKLYADRAFRLQAIVTIDQFRHHELLVRRYLQCLTSVHRGGSTPSTANDSAAPTEYLAWARVHTLDPENAIIGMQPDHTIIRLLPDWEHRAKLGTASSPSTPIQIGDIAITRKPKTNDYVYTRIASVSDGTTYERLLSQRMAPGQGVVGVYIRPDEAEVMQTYYLYPLPSLGRECLAGGCPERLVRQWSDDLKAEIKDKILGKVAGLLVDAGVNEAELKELPKQKATIFESPMLRRARRKILPILSTFASAGHRDELVAYVDREYAQFFGRDFSDCTAFFLPRIEASIADLQAARSSFYTLAEDTLQLYINYCESGLEQVKLDKKQLLNGSVKSEMTNWWLKLIATRMEQFVQQRGYDMTVIPYDYLDKPPKDMAAVRKNLEVIEGVLKELNEKSKAQPIHKAISDLSEDILPKVEAFISQSVMTVTEILWLPSDRPDALNSSSSSANEPRERPMSVLVEEHSHDSVSTLRAKLEERKAELDAETVRLVSGQLMDIDYLQAMLLKSWNPQPTKLGLDGPVPLEGIAVGRIIRFENELRTVLERWGREKSPLRKEGGAAAKEKEEPASTLHKVLDDPTIAPVFRRYAADKHAADMLICWETIEAYKHMNDADRLTEAPLLVRKFCDPESPSSISPDEDIVLSIQGKLNASPGSRTAFDDLQALTWQMLEFGLCQKFLLSEEYKKIQARRIASPERRPSFSASVARVFGADKGSGLLGRLAMKSPERTKSPLANVRSPERARGTTEPVRPVGEVAVPSPVRVRPNQIPDPPAALQASNRRLLMDDKDRVTARPPGLSTPPALSPSLMNSMPSASSALSYSSSSPTPPPSSLAQSAPVNAPLMEVIQSSNPTQARTPSPLGPRPPSPISNPNLQNPPAANGAPVYFTTAAIAARSPSPLNLRPVSTHPSAPLVSPLPLKTAAMQTMRETPGRLSDVPLSSSGLLMSLMDEKVIIHDEPEDQSSVLQPKSVKDTSHTEYAAIPISLPDPDERQSQGATPTETSPRAQAMTLSRARGALLRSPVERSISPKPGAPPPSSPVSSGTPTASSASSPFARRSPTSSPRGDAGTRLSAPKIDISRSLSPRPAPPPTEQPVIVRLSRPGADAPPRARPSEDEGATTASTEVAVRPQQPTQTQPAVTTTPLRSTPLQSKPLPPIPPLARSESTKSPTALSRAEATKSPVK